jgi:glycosyltransferase involved in cell wall biosynthesis
MSDPAVSVVVPAKDEAAYLPECLESLHDQRTDREYEVLVVDGDSDDATAEIAREYGATLVEQPNDLVEHQGASASDSSQSRIADARHRGAERADGDWLAFVDADTVLDPAYLDAMLRFVRREGLAGASSRCRMVGPARATVMEATINHVFPRLARPVLPGFNCFVRRDAYFDVGGFPDVPNEDTAFSRTLGREWPTGYHPEVLVETSARRIADSGLTGMLVHYLRLDWHRIRADY